MKEKHFETIKQIEKRKAPSNYFKFLLDVKGLTFKTKNGYEIDKWELYFVGYNSLQEITKSKQFISTHNL